MRTSIITTLAKIGPIVSHEAYHKPNVAQLRDRLRDGLAGTNFIVSDIADWDGSRSGYTTLGFVIKNGTREWLFMFPYSTGSNNRFRYAFGPGGAREDYFIGSDPTSGAGRKVESPVVFHYNCGISSYNMGFDNLLDLTYSSGDFGSPAVNPATQGYDFMPVGQPLIDSCLWGYAGLGVKWASSLRILFVFDGDSSITVYSTGGGMNFPYVGLLMGEFTQNTDVADTNREFVGVIQTSISGYPYGWTGDHESGDRHAGAFDLAGVRQKFDYLIDRGYTPENALNQAGEFKWKSVGLSNNDYEKGILNTNLVRETGAYRLAEHYQTLIDGPEGPLFRWCTDLAFPYTEDTERFPWPEY